MHYSIDNVVIESREGSKIIIFDMKVDDKELKNLKLWACVAEDDRIVFEHDSDFFYFDGADSKRLLAFFPNCTEVPGLTEKLKSHLT
jgi:hypothetical protein